MNYLRYIKKAYKVIPGKYKSKTLLYIILSFFNLVLELFSIAMIIPLIFLIIDKEALVGFSSFINLNSILDSSYFLLSSVLAITVLFIIKNVFSIRIVKYQTVKGFQIASNLSLLFAQNYIYKDFIEFSKQDKASAIRDIAEIPNKFVAYVLLALNTISAELLLLIFIFVISLLINAFVTLLLALIFGFSVFITQLMSRKKLTQINKQLPANYSNNMANLLNILSGFFELKTSGKERYFLSKFEKSSIVLNDAYANLHARSLITPKYTEVMILLVIGSILLFYNYFSSDTNSYLFYVSFLASAAIKVVPSVNKIIINFQNFKSHLFTIDLIAEIHDIKQPIDFSKAQSLFYNRKLELRNIHFSYAGNILLQGINTAIKKGEIIAIIGNSGAGKSSLLYIIGQFITAQKGGIYLDDVLINKKNKDAFLDLISYIPQQPLVLEGTVMDNITLGGAVEFNMDDVNQLLKEFEMLEIINNLPERLNTFIGNNGYQLAGGQLQRLAIIRALLSNPQILLMDEATNQLEKNLELKVLKKLKESALLQKRTIILISHHIENISSICDHIYKLARGELSLVKSKGD